MEKLLVKTCVFNSLQHLLMVDDAEAQNRGRQAESKRGRRAMKALFGGSVPSGYLPVPWLLHLLQQDIGLGIQANQVIPYQFSVAVHDHGGDYNLCLYYIILLSKHDMRPHLAPGAFGGNKDWYWIPVAKIGQYCALETLSLSDQEFLAYIALTNSLLKQPPMKAY